MHEVKILIRLLCFCSVIVVNSQLSPSYNNSKIQKLFKTRVTSTPVQQAAVYALINRIRPDLGAQFDIRIMNTSNITGVLWGGAVIDSNKEKIRIRASSGVEAARAVHELLRQNGAHFSWDGTQTATLPAKLPLPTKTKMITPIRPVRYFGNVCTFSYSFVWWNLTRWEQHIDWLALQGFNMPLMQVGMEATLTQMWLKLGLNLTQIADFFTGPPFLAWNRMGNFELYGGPLSDHWLNDQLKLGKNIYARMTSFGMLPVLPAFAGHVPRALKSIYTNASISEGGCWNGFTHNFTCVDFLNPIDPLFQTVADEWMQAFTSLFGRSGFYTADPFNEMRPQTYETHFVSKVSRAIYSGIANTDNDAVWVLQGWFFLNDPNWLKNNSGKAFMNANNIGNMLVLDLDSVERPQYIKTDSYYGQPFVFNMIHNFGGILEMHGDSLGVDRTLYKYFTVNNTGYGVGLTMEGIFQNYAIYQFAIDRYWLNGINKPQLDWVKEYTEQRYGFTNSDLQYAWMLIWATIYGEAQYATNLTNYEISKYTATSNENNLFSYNPIFNRPSSNLSFRVWYPISKLCSAWDRLVSILNRLGEKANNHFRHDIVDVTREVLAVIGGVKFMPMLLDSAKSYDTNRTITAANLFLRLFDDLNYVLETDAHFMLVSWIKEARVKTISVIEGDKYEEEFRNQITLWGPRGEIIDYARKQWNGLIQSYYKARWALFAKYLIQSTIDKTPVDQTRFNKVVFDNVEKPFTLDKSNLNQQPAKELNQRIAKIRDKYINVCYKL